MKKQQVLLVSGVLAYLLGAFLMSDESILGEKTTGIATVLGITGIGLISSHIRSE